jgi:hypothetical protein
MTKKHVNNGTFNFDDFKCKKTIDTASIANHDNGYNRQSLLSSTPSSRKHVVIIGGSFAGLCAARHLSNNKEMQKDLLGAKTIK